MPGPRAQAVLRAAALLGLAAASSCSSCRPPPDPDGVAEAASELELGSLRADQLDCRRGDCVDWYWIELPESGDLALELRSAAVEIDRELTLSLIDPEGRLAGDARAVGGVEAGLRREVGPGVYRISVATLDADRKPFPYAVRSEFEPTPPPPPPPPPPRPRFETLRAEVLEIDGTTAVLIDAGTEAGVRRGMRGRLIEAGSTLCEIRIEDAFPEGSRARIEGKLRGAITPDTLVEILVPVSEGGGSPGP